MVRAAIESLYDSLATAKVLETTKIDTKTGRPTTERTIAPFPCQLSYRAITDDGQSDGGGGDGADGQTVLRAGLRSPRARILRLNIAGACWRFARPGVRPSMTISRKSRLSTRSATMADVTLNIDQWKKFAGRPSRKRLTRNGLTRAKSNAVRLMAAAYLRAALKRKRQPEEARHGGS